MDVLSDEEPTLRAIEAEPADKSVPGRRVGKAERTTHEPLHPGPDLAVLPCAVLRLRLPHRVLLWSDMARVGAPPRGVKAGDAKRFSPCFQRENHRVFAPSNPLGSHTATVMIHRMP